MNVKDPWTPTFQTQRGLSWLVKLLPVAFLVLMFLLWLGLL